MKDKKGLEARYIVLIFVLIISFIVILIFYRTYLWEGEVDKQVCHQSVIYKATVPNVPIVNNKVVDLPLKCQTEKICITSNLFKAGDCDEDFLGEKYQTVRISGDKDKWEKEINQIIADKLYECWWMMGEGKVQLYGKDFSDKKICTICTRIAFDKELKDKIERVNGYQNYLLRNNVPSSDKTYWMYLTNSELNYIEGYSKETDFLTLSQKAIVFAQIEDGTWEKWIGAAGGALIGSIVPGVGTAVGAGIGSVAGYVLGDKINSFFNKENVASTWKITEYNIKSLKDMSCTSFEGMV